MSDLLDRLATKFTVSDDCWEWTACRMPFGHGQVWANGRVQLAHRVIYELLVGPIPDGLELDHLCRNPSCVRPSHLEPVPHVINVRRGNAGKKRGAQLLARTHCKNGHPWDEANTHQGKRQRICRACQRTWSAQRRQKAKEEA